MNAVFDGKGLIVVRDGETIDLGKRGGNYLTLYEQKDLIHLPGGVCGVYKFGTNTFPVSVSTVFDVAGEIDASGRFSQEGYFRKLSSDVMVGETTLAYKTQNPGTRREREREIVDGIAQALKEMRAREEGGLIAMPAFSQYRICEVMRLLFAALSETGFTENDVHLVFQGPLATRMIDEPGSPYEYARLFLDRMEKNLDFDFVPDGTVHVVVATPGFAYKDTFAGKAVDSAIRSRGKVILSSSYAPKASPLREILEEGKYNDEPIPAGIVQVYSLTGHPTYGETYARIVEAVAPQVIYPVHGSPETIASYLQLVKPLGYTEGKNIFVPEPGRALIAYSDKRGKRYEVVESGLAADAVRKMRRG